MTMNLLQDKTILITGGTRGIGKELVLQALEQGGAKAVIATGTSSASIERAKDDFGQAVADKISWIACDLSQAEDRAKLVSEVKGYDLDGIIHNAGVSAKREYFPATDNAAATQKQTISVEDETTINFIAPVELAEALLPKLSEKSDTFVTFVTSGLALAPKKTSPVYCATKAAMRSYCKSLRAQCEQSTATNKVRIIEALPPAVATDLTAGRGDDESKMSPSDVANLILEGISSGQSEIYIGKSNLLRWILWLSPTLGEKLVINKP